jgi:hypothetical protein
LAALVFLTLGSISRGKLGAAYASAELQRQAYIETPVASGVDVEANSKNTMLTPITEDTIMLAKTNTFCYRSGFELQGEANMTKWSTLHAFTSYPPAVHCQNYRSSQIQQYSSMDKGHNLAHASLGSVSRKMIAAIN